MKFTYNNKTFELILLITSGSRLYGNSTPESDWDYRGVYIESTKDRIGILPRTEQLNDGQTLNIIFKKAGIIKHDTDDIVVYELDKFVKLSIDNNPNIMDILNISDTDEGLLYVSEKGKKLLNARNLFLSSKIKFTFSGYAIAQLKRIKGHNKMITRFPEINKVVSFLKELYEDKLINYNFIKDNFSGELANSIADKSENPLSVPFDKVNELFKEKYNFTLDMYRKPQLIDYCNAYTPAHEKLDMNTWVHFDLDKPETTTVKTFIQKFASFRKISNSVIAVFDKGKGIFSSEGNLKGNDYENLGEFKFLVQIDTFNYKSDSDVIQKVYHWKINRNVKRNVLEVKHGYDTKHGSHLIRLLRQCITILKTGKYNPRLKGEDLQEVIDTRAGKYSYDELITLSKELDEQCNTLYKSCELPRKASLKDINKLVLELRDIKENKCKN